MVDKKAQETLGLIFDKLYGHLGPQRWWPAKTPFEVIVGAILTQNTAWPNVEKAIVNLRKENLLTARALKAARLTRLARFIRPSGYYNQKARKLKSFVSFLYADYGGRLGQMFEEDTSVLRDKLLGVHGIGPETADSILLYAGKRAVFVVDAYTRRVLSRHNLVKADASYSHIQDYFMDNMARDVRVFNEFHALIVRLCKVACKTKPDCIKCPLKDTLA